MELFRKKTFPGLQCYKNSGTGTAVDFIGRLFTLQIHPGAGSDPLTGHFWPRAVCLTSLLQTQSSIRCWSHPAQPVSAAPPHCRCCAGVRSGELDSARRCWTCTAELCWYLESHKHTSFTTGEQTRVSKTHSLSMSVVQKKRLTSACETT